MGKTLSFDRDLTWLGQLNHRIIYTYDVAKGKLAAMKFVDLAKKLKQRILNPHPAPMLFDMEKDFLDLYEQCRPYTMTSIERMYSLYKSVEYICSHNIPGDFVECGVWKGGSSMMMALAAQKWNQTHRQLYLYDTYEGMSEPTENDVEALEGQSAQKLLDETQDQKEDHIMWCYSGLDEVKKNLASTGYPADKIHYVQGKVEDTIPATLPEKICILRLDTDWYESTYHELTHLYPLLSSKGALIIDDYGHWVGAKKAVDQYFQEQQTPYFLHRIDYSGRMLIRP